MLNEITLHDRMRISVETRCDLRTIARAYAGKPVTAASRARILAAAERLGLDPPPPPTLRRPGA